MMNRFVKMSVLLMLALMLVFPCIAMADYSMPVADDALDAVEGLDENWINILLIGTDSRERDLTRGRSDTMMICSLNKQTGDVRITSLARDTWVTMGDNGHQNKLNAAHTFGGPNLLMQTINRTYGMNIEDYVTVNFYGVCDIVDALGGVTVQMEEGEPWAINSSVTEEYGAYNEDTAIVPIERDAEQAHLSGAQALAYIRIRKLDNDFGRQNRQRRLLGAMYGAVRECSITELIGVIQTCLQHVKTNLSFTEIVTLAAGVLDHGVKEIQMQAFPDEGEYQYDSADGVSKLIVDFEAGKQKIHSFIYQ